MKIIDIPPYRNVRNFDPKEGHFMIRELIDNMRKKGQLEGVDIDIDDAYPTEHTAENRDEEVLASITPGFLTRVREYSEMGKYDAGFLPGG